MTIAAFVRACPLVTVKENHLGGTIFESPQERQCYPPHQFMQACSTGSLLEEASYARKGDHPDFSQRNLEGVLALSKFRFGLREVVFPIRKVGLQVRLDHSERLTSVSRKGEKLATGKECRATAERSLRGQRTC